MPILYSCFKVCSLICLLIYLIIKFKFVSILNMTIEICTHNFLELWSQNIKDIVFIINSFIIILNVNVLR